MKRLPCQYCAARGGKKHAANCNRPRTLKVTDAVAAAATPSTKHPTARPQDVLRNRIALVIDASSSMFGRRNDVPRVVNEQVAEIKKNAAKLGQPTSLTIYLFASSVSEAVHYEDVFSFNGFNNYSTGGQTALFDAVGLAIEDFQRSIYSNDPNTSFLVITTTDGEENNSRRYGGRNLMALMESVVRTDRWTFVFSTPASSKRTIQNLGIPEGNIQVWEQTDAGFASMNTNTVGGLSNYYICRSVGVRSMSNFFQPDLTKVRTRDIRNLKDLSRDFHSWNVDQTSPIREFVEDKLSQQPALARRVGQSYQIGRGYYQLTKSEEVQAGKDMAILDKNTNAIYGGNDARQLIGCPMNTSFKIKPGNHANYEIYIKSTSVNRKLIPGTKVLYFVG